MIQVFDLISDATERHNLAPTNASLVAHLLDVVARFNSSAYTEPLFFRYPPESKCPFVNERGELTPCEIPVLE